MQGYNHLTLVERYQIYNLKQVGKSNIEIGKIIGVHKSTIGRELKRNKGEEGYKAEEAEKKGSERKRQAHRGGRINKETWREVEERLKEEWSPEQISGRRKLEGKEGISHERIYLYIYEDKEKGGELYKHLRSQKKRRKRIGKNDRRGKLKNCISIEKRPEIVDKKERIGDWEGDTIIGEKHKGAIVTMVERKSKMLKMGKVERKGGEEVKEETKKILKGMKVKTITLDNGREFAGHEEIGKELGAEIYFAHPYTSWERGLNENTNGLIRQYFKKGSSFGWIGEEEIRRVEEKLNNRPRKTLGYSTPQEVYMREHT